MNASTCFSLDIWLTLIRSDKRYRPERDEIAYEMAGLPSSISLKAFRDALRWGDVTADRYAERTGDHYGMKERFDLAAEGLGLDGFDIDYDALGRECDELLKTYHPMPMHPLAPKTITTLAQRHPVMYASNTGMLDGARLTTILTNLGYPELPAVFSDEVGASKPSDRFFRHVTDHFGDDAVILHVGDNTFADGIGARRNGLWYVQVDEKNTVVDALAEAVR